MLTIDGISLAYGDQTVVSDVSLTASDGEVLGILGPSGCGKSTLLRAIAGLESPVTGRIQLDGRDLAGLRPDQREVGLMFQEHALFPHRTVADNVAFGPRMRGLDGEAIGRRVTQSLELVGLHGMGSRRIDALSGGERQRVALARAVAPRPRLLMLDEPLGSLDRALQTRLLQDLPRVFAELGTTVVYVTHDQHEVLSLADRVAVMRAGRIEQVGSPTELWRDPRTAFVARFLGLERLLHAPVVAGRATTPWGWLPAQAIPDGTATLVLLSDALRLSDGHDLCAGGRSDERGARGTVTARRFAGDHLRVTVTLPSGPALTVPVWRGEGPRLGEEVVLALDPTRVRFLPDEPPTSEALTPLSEPDDQ